MSDAKSYSEGFDEGFRAGFIEGVQSGYAQGYDDATRAAMMEADDKIKKKMEPSYQREEQVKKGTGVHNETN